jgi:hypothetical protein
MSGGVIRKESLRQRNVSAHVMETCALFSHSDVTDCFVFCPAARDG